MIKESQKLIIRRCVAAMLLGVLCLLSPHPLPAQESSTAEELYTRGFLSYSGGKWAEAESQFNQFLSDFGTSSQAAEAIKSILPCLALCQVQLKKFDAALTNIDRSFAEVPTLPAATREDLAFWKGIAEMSLDKYDEAIATFQKFCATFPRSTRLGEAQILITTILITQEKWVEGSAAAAAIKDRVTPSERGRAAVLELYGYIKADKPDDGLRLLVTEYPRMGDMLQIASFQTLALELGSLYLEKEKYREAIACLQRIWSRERLTTHQKDRLQASQKRLEAMEAVKADPVVLFQLRQTVSKIKRELETLAKIEDFDSALRLRLASAFLGMQRYREAALIMESMLKEMPPDPVVEGASLNLVRCWAQIERWPKVAEAALDFEKKFPKSPSLPQIIFMKGDAEQQLFDYDASEKTMEMVVSRFPQDPIAARALFMKGFAQLQKEENDAAIETFDQVGASYPKDEMAEVAFYWKGMAYSLGGQSEKCREQLAEYLKRYPKGRFISESVYRRAYAAQAMKDFPTSIKELNDFLQKYPQSDLTSEALVLLGDAYMNEGDIDKGIAVFKRVDPTQKRFFEEGWFKIGKALKLQENNKALRAHMEEFQKRFARSPRVAEAIYWIGWTYRQEEQIDQARKVYWDAIRELGDDETIRSTEDLFPALTRLYSGDDEKQKYRTELKDLELEAAGKNQKTLQMRAMWARAAAIRKTDPEAARALLLAASKLANVQTTNPMLLADFAGAMRDMGDLKGAEQVYKDLIKWNPRASQKAEALAGLGAIAISLGREKEALDYYARFEREVTGSRLIADVLLSKAKLLEARGDLTGAQAALEAMLAAPVATGKQKAEALLQIGDMKMAEKNPGLAQPYFQRIYIMHGRWSEYVAKAYLRSGQAFEQLNEPEKALKTYEEMIAREELAEFKEIQAAKERVAALGGVTVSS